MKNKINIIYLFTSVVFSLFLLIEIKLCNEIILKERKIIYALVTLIFSFTYMVIFIFNIILNWKKRVIIFLSFFWIVFLVYLFYINLKSN